jgi:hypothetical protein
MDDITGDEAYAALEVDQCDLAEDIKGFWNTRYKIWTCNKQQILGKTFRWNCRPCKEEGAATDCGQ